MGFGILFCAYFFAFGFSPGANYIVGIVGIIGTVLLYIASHKLAVHSKTFVFATYASIILTLSYAISVVINFVTTAEDVSKLMQAFMILAVFTYNFLMYKGISEISLIAENSIVHLKAVRMTIIVIIYYLTVASASISSYFSFKITPLISLLSALFSIIWLIGSLRLIFYAYMRICMPGDEDMPIKHKHK